MKVRVDSEGEDGAVVVLFHRFAATEEGTNDDTTIV